MKNIQYGNILKNAFSISWENKFLWVFGFFIFLGSIGFSTSSEKKSESGSAVLVLKEFSQQHPNVIILLGIFLMVVMVIFFLLKIIATASIIKAVNNISLYKQLSTKAIFFESKSYLKKLLSLEVAVGIVLTIIIVIMFAPVFYLFFIEANALAVAMLIVAVLILIPLIILAYYLRKYAYFYIILGDFGIKISMEMAYEKFAKKFKESLIMGVICIGLGILLLISIFIGGIALVFVFGLIGFVAQLLFAQIGVIVTVVIGVIVAVALYAVLFSWYMVFLQTSWFLFFQQISFEKSKDIIEKTELNGEVSSPETI